MRSTAFKPCVFQCPPLLSSQNRNQKSLSVRSENNLKLEDCFVIMLFISAPITLSHHCDVVWRHASHCPQFFCDVSLADICTLHFCRSHSVGAVNTDFPHGRLGLLTICSRSCVEISFGTGQLLWHCKADQRAPTNATTVQITKMHPGRVCHHDGIVVDCLYFLPTGKPYR